MADQNATRTEQTRQEFLDDALAPLRAFTGTLGAESDVAVVFRTLIDRAEDVLTELLVKDGATEALAGA